MGPELQHFVWLACALLCGFTALGMLRVLAVFQESEIEKHDVARNAKLMRHTYESNKKKKKDNKELVA